MKEQKAKSHGMQGHRVIVLFFARTVFALVLPGFSLPLLAGEARPGQPLQPFCRPPIPPMPIPAQPPREPDPTCRTCPENCQGSPCHVQRGTYRTSAVDLQLPTSGFPLTVARTYDTSRDWDGYMGVGWKTTLTAQLFYSTRGFVPPSTYLKAAYLMMPDGEMFTYSENADGINYTGPPGRYDRLVKNGDGTWDLTLARSLSRYRFAADGRLATQADDYGNTLSYTYDGMGRLQRVSDASGSGRYLDVSFGPDGRIHIVRDSGGRLVEYLYNNAVLTTVIDAAGRRTEYSYQLPGYYAWALLTQATDHWGRVVASATYDGSDRVQTYMEQGESFTMTYDSGNGKTYEADSAGNRWEFNYLSTGVVTHRRLPDGTFAKTDYYADGTIQQVTDEVGVKTFFTYTSQGAILTVTRDYQGPTAVRFDYAYDPTFPGRVASITPRKPSTGQIDPDWQAWRYDYHPAGSPAPGALFHVYRIRSDLTEDTVATYVYNGRGQVTKFTNARGGVTDYGYDGAGNLTSVTGPSNNGAGTRPMTVYVPDGIGRVTSMTDPLGKTTSFTYDALNRILTVTLPKPSVSSPLNFVTTYSYDRNPSGDQLFTHIADPSSRVSRLGYDQFGRLVDSIDTLGNETTYTYSRGLLDSIEDANGNETRYVYDTVRRLKETRFPDGSGETYTYHNDGLLNVKTDQRGRTIQYGYDGQKRLSSKSYAVGSIAYTYAGQKLTQVSDTSVSPTETHTFAYDTSYRVSSSGQASRGSIGYSYNPDDSVASYTVGGGGPTATYAYYPDGSLDTISWSPVAGQFKYSYDLAGRYQAVTFPNGQSRGFAHDHQGRLTQFSNTHPTAGNLATYSYSYDRDHATGTDTMLGQRTGMTATVPSQGLTNALTKYRYDAAYRLTRAEYPNVTPFNGEVHSWSYDGIGNRLTNTVNAVTQIYSYQKVGTNPNNWQRLLSDGANSYAYDANGNTTTKTTSSGVFNFTWDAENRLTGISGLASASYQYDYQGRRAEKTLGASTTEYLYDGLNLLAEQPGLAANYLYGPGIDQPLAMLRGGAISYYVTDGLGSVASLVSSVGAVQNSYLYDAWGVTRSQTGSISNPFGYTGRELGEAGTLFYRARYYQPSTGRFASEDPLRLLAGVNFYSYALNRPAYLIDPDGRLVPLILAGAGVGALVGAGVYALFAGDEFTWQGLAGAAAGGAIAGGLGVIATPIAASLGLGTGLAGTAAVNFGVGAISGLVSAALDPCQDITHGYLLASAGFGALGGAFAQRFIPTGGMAVFGQKGFPRTWSGVVPRVLGGNAGRNALRGIYAGGSVAVGVGSAGPLLPVFE